MSAQSLSPLGRRQQDPPAKSADMKKCDECDRKQAEIERLEAELNEWQQRCRLAEEQSLRTRDELQSLEGEMEELHDNFKEEENEQFEQVKQELDACLKNCKILQIRLNKSERQYNQLEQVKEMLERQLQERLSNAIPANMSMQRANGTDCDNKTTRQQDKAPFELEINPSGSQGNEMEFVKLTASEYDQILRDLNDTSERERDLQEQIKYSQEEAQMKGERLQAIEVENEILMGRINKLTLANSSLRSSSMLNSSLQVDQTSASNLGANESERVQKFRELCEQNEHMKLALELAQSEAERLRARLQEGHKLLEEAKDKVVQAKREAEQEAAGQDRRQQTPRASSRLELECRQLRARLVHSERECRQLRSQLECLGQGGTPTASRRLAAGPGLRSYSLESPSTTSGQLQDGCGQISAACGSGRCQELVRQLERQYKSSLDRNNQLELKLKKLVEISSENLEQRSSSLESELINKLKLQLDTSESELAKAKSRLVELDIECGRAQRQYKRLMTSLESCGSDGNEFQLLRRNKLPNESLRDLLSRQELRQAVRDLELDIEDLMTIIRAKECLIKEQSGGSSRKETSGDISNVVDFEPDRGEQQQQQTSSIEQQVKSLRRQLDQERLLSNNLKLDVANLEQDNQELKSGRLVLEREKLAMDEEVDKLRQRLGEQHAELEDGEAERQRLQSRQRELNETIERLKMELAEASRRQNSVSRPGSAESETESSAAKRDLLLMARDLSELKVKNGFLMRQLEMAREDSARQLEELKVAYEAQQRRAVELAQIELRERHLQESQVLRDELSELKQKLAQANRQTARQEEEVKQERERSRAIERDWRRDKQQWQQAREQLEAQLAIEKRSSELRLKEVESVVRDKERNLISMQDRCVQLERDLKRIQNKYHLLEEDTESKIKQLSRELETRTRDLNETTRQKRAQEEQQYDSWRRLNEEKSTLKETLETIKRSYDEKLAEARQLRDLIKSRQEQAYKERGQLLDRVEALTRRQTELLEHETQTKLIKQRLEILERQLEVTRRELISVKEERAKLRDRCDELEKRELISKTSSISGSSSTSFMRPFGSKAQLVGKPAAQSPATQAMALNRSVSGSGAASVGGSGWTSSEAQQQQQTQSQLLIEKLSGKINDQRNLINILRQQCNESQVELKQMRLLQASERSKWQATVAQLTGRLNECEEKLAFETLVLQANPIAIDQLARPKLEANWQWERQAQLDLIKQQQSQVELLTRDHKKLSQAHDLLRMHSKQLEGHNNKLSKRLIELQQSSFAQPQQADRRLESIHQQLLNQHRTLSHELRPVLEIVSKMVSSLDAPEQQQRQTTLSTSRPICSGTRSPSSDSTERPLRAGATPAGASRVSSDQESDLEVATSSRPAGNQPNKTGQTQNRFTQLLAGGKLANNNSNLSNIEPSATVKATTTKSTRRVRIKCSTLGITTAEKKQLKQQLKKLTESLEPDSGVDQRWELAADKAPDSRPHSSSTNETTTNQTDKQTQQRQAQLPRIRWQLDSDLDSERSWSLEPTSNDQQRSDVYRRFPQATPSGHSQRRQSGAHSLTEYESESSLAGSDFSLAAGHTVPANAPRASGAESDSGLTTKLSNGRKKSMGLKGRLTSTLRTISRSITGLGTSDTEDSGEVLASRRLIRSGDSKSGRETRV